MFISNADVPHRFAEVLVVESNPYNIESKKNKSTGLGRIRDRKIHQKADVIMSILKNQQNKKAIKLQLIARKAVVFRVGQNCKIRITSIIN